MIITYEDNYNAYQGLLKYTDTGKFTFVSKFRTHDSSVSSKTRAWIDGWGDPSASYNLYKFVEPPQGVTANGSHWMFVSSGDKNALVE